MQIYWISGERLFTSLLHHPYLYAIYALLCLVAWRLKWLTLGGSIAAFLMAVAFHFSGLESFLLPLWLLVGGTLVSKLNSKEQSEGRNAIQVLANGGIGVICLLASQVINGYLNQIICYAAYVISFCISICDTFSSETGKYVKGKTWDILTFERVGTGLSGGISLSGTIGGLVGLFPAALILGYQFNIDINSLVLILGLGFTGMLLDSILGSLLQAKYKDASANISENPQEGYVLYKGYRWCTNDVVNLISNLLVVAGFLLVEELYF